MRPYLIILCLCCSFCLPGQEILEGLEYLPKSTGDKKWRPLFAFDSRRSSFESRNVKIRGLRLGAEHRGVHRFGLASYSMANGSTFKGIDVQFDDAQSDPEVLFDVNYATFFYERVVIQADRWDVSTPVFLGGGTLTGSYGNIHGEFIPYLKEDFSLLGTGFMARYKVLPWLAPGIGAGHQIVFDSSPEVKKTLQQPYYVIKVSILLGELYRSTLQLWIQELLLEHETESDY